MTTKIWTGQGLANGNATPANSSGTSGSAGDAFTAITLAGAGTAVYSNLNPLITAHVALLLSAAAGGTDRARAYQEFAASDQLSSRFAFRMRQDPGAANVVFSFVIAGTFGVAGGLSVTTVAGVRQLILTDAAGATKKNFGALTFGSAVTDWYIADINITKGTGPTDGRLECRLYDDTGTLIDSYLATNVNTGTAQYLRAQWGGNAGILQALDVCDIMTSNDAPAALQGVPTAPATLPPTLSLVTYIDKVVVKANGVAKAGGTLSYAADPAAADTPGAGIFVFNRQASTGVDYDELITVTESGSNKTASAAVTVPKMAAAGGSGYAPRRPSGSLVPGSMWVSTASASPPPGGGGSSSGLGLAPLGTSPLGQ